MDDFAKERQHEDALEVEAIVALLAVESVVDELPGDLIP